MNQRKKYDSTVARIAGNLLSGSPWLDAIRDPYQLTQMARSAVYMAREIVRAAEESEPPKDEVTP
jgi:hypothetical protein